MIFEDIDIRLKVRIYEVGANGQTQGKAMYQHQGPVLDVCWNKVRIIQASFEPSTNLDYRMGPRYFLEVPIMLAACSM